MNALIVLAAAPAGGDSSGKIVGYVVAFGLGAILLEVIRSFLQRKQMGANAAKTITEAATTLLAPLQSRVKELEATVDATQERLQETQEKLGATQVRLAEAHASLESTVERLVSATTELEHLRQRVEARETLMDEREDAAQARQDRRDAPGS